MKEFGKVFKAYRNGARAYFVHCSVCGCCERGIALGRLETFLNGPNGLVEKGWKKDKMGWRCGCHEGSETLNHRWSLRKGA